MNSLESYRKEWEQLLQLLLKEPEHIRELATLGQLKTSKFRSLYWTLLLRVLTTDFQTWSEQRLQQRQRLEEFLRNPSVFVTNSLEESGETLSDHPLSQSEESIWHQYFNDEHLLTIIRQDVIRAFPGVDFFRKLNIQNSMCKLMSYYAREHPYMGYRQGMHEILGPLIFVMYSDHQSLLSYLEMVNHHDSNINLLKDVLNPEYLESDCYFLFARLMAAIESYYRVDERNYSPTISKDMFIKTDHHHPNYHHHHHHQLKSSDSSPPPLPSQFFYGKNPDVNNDSRIQQLGVITHLNMIRDFILIREDYQLYDHLIKLDIPLHIFGIRWLRLLFGREFAFVDLLLLWDAFFADSDRFDLPNYMIVAMLCRIRDKLLRSDYNGCLTFLMRYPNGLDMSSILQHALHLQRPKKYSRPKDTFLPRRMSNGSMVSNVIKDLQLNNDIIDSRRRFRNPLNIKNIWNELMPLNQRSSSSTLPTISSKEDHHHHHHNHHHLKKQIERLHLELQNTQSIIMVTRHKLLKYLEILHSEGSLESNGGHNLSEVRDGIEDLCDFLDIRWHSPPSPPSPSTPPPPLAPQASQRFNEPIEVNKRIQLHGGENIENIPGNHGRGNCNDHHDDNDNLMKLSSSHSYERPLFRDLEQLNPNLVNQMEIELNKIEMETKICGQIGGSTSSPYLPPIDPISST